MHFHDRKKLEHKNLVNLVEVIDDAKIDRMYLVQEFAEKGPVMKQGTDEPPIDAEHARNIFRQTLKGLEYLHFQNIIHRDIKPENILMAHDGTVKICDFGVSVVKETGDDSLADDKGTPAFMAPEALDPEEFPIAPTVGEKKRGEAIDMWSLGATLYQLVVGKPPFLASNMFLLAEKIKTTRADIPLHLDPALRNILQKPVAGLRNT